MIKKVISFFFLGTRRGILTFLLMSHHASVLRKETISSLANAGYDLIQTYNIVSIDSEFCEFVLIFFCLLMIDNFRPLSKTVRFNVLKVIPAGSSSSFGKKAFTGM